MSDKLAKQIGRRIKAIRTARGLTAEQLAYQNDFSKGYLSDIESGQRLPSLKMLEKIAKALDVKIQELF